MNKRLVYNMVKKYETKPIHCSFNPEIMRMLHQTNYKTSLSVERLVELAEKNEQEMLELRKDLMERLDEIDAGISAIEEQIEVGVIKEVETNGYVRGIEHAQKIIEKNFKK